MTVDFKVTNQTLECISDYRAAEGTENYIKLCFGFSDDWKGLTKTALMLCRGMDDPAVVYLDENDCCYIPNGISGVCHISLAGSDGNVTATTNIVTFNLEKTIQPGEATDFENPASDFSELIRRMNEIKAEIVDGTDRKISGKADKTDIAAVQAALALKADSDTVTDLRGSTYNELKAIQTALDTKADRQRLEGGMLALENRIYGNMNIPLSQKADKFTIQGSVSDNTLLLSEKTDTRLISAEVSALTLTVPNYISGDYECYLSFKSGETATTLTYSAAPIKWVGTDCDSTGDFVPVSNRIYEIGIKNIGNDSEGNPVIIARVGAC